MDSQTVLLLIGVFTAMLTSPFIAVFIQSLFNKKKIGAEVQNLNITGEISIGTAWQQYAKQQESDTKQLRSDFKELQTNFLKLGNDFEIMKREKDAEIKLKDKKIEELEHRIETLETELATHKKK